jgi:hypothetical protein
MRDGVDEAVAQPATEMTIAACLMEESLIVALAEWWSCRRRYCCMCRAAATRMLD